MGKKYEKLLIVDEAHGCLWNFTDKLLSPALQSGADAVVHSLHKTGGSMSQSSMLHIAENSMLDCDEIEKSLKLLHTTSPSLMLLASLDAARANLESPKGQKQLEKAINNANRIYILGVRSTAPLANFISFYFKMVYENVILITSASSSEEFEQIFKIGKGDVCIAISFPRYSKQVVKTLEYAREKEAKIIAITDSNSSPIAPLSNYVLTAKSNMASFLDSLVAPLSLINALIVEATMEKRDEVLETFGELENVWDKYDVYEKSEDIINE